MSGAIGSKLFLWCGIEKALEVALLAQHGGQMPKGHHGIRSRILLWSSQILEVGEQRPLQRQVCGVVVSHLEQSLDLRNLICHGLIGVSASHTPNDPEAHLTVERAKVQRKIYWGDLQPMFAWMSRAPYTIEDLTAAAMTADDESANRGLYAWRRFPQIE